MISEFILTATIFLPLIFTVVVLFLPKEKERVIKLVGLAGTALTFLISLILYFGFNASVLGFQFQQKTIWISSLNISYHVGIDGMSLLLILLTTFLTPLALLGTWNSIQRQIKNYTAMVLLLEVGMIGVFASLDLFLFYIFWEAMLIPMYFLIGIWGGQNRIYAAVKFFLYTLFGSLLMLVAIISLGYFASTVSGGRFTTDLLDLYQVAPLLPVDMQMWMFAAFGLSFAIKVPLWPLHTWLPDAHVEAPTAGSVILAGVLLKMGTYGFIRFNLPLFAEASLRAIPLMCTLAVIGIVYGALVAMVQTGDQQRCDHSESNCRPSTFIHVIHLCGFGQARVSRVWSGVSPRTLTEALKGDYRSVIPSSLRGRPKCYHSAMRILVAEDEKKIAGFVRKALEEQGYSVGTSRTTVTRRMLSPPARATI